MNNKKTRPPKTLKCSRSKTIRPRKLKSSHHVDLMRSAWYELFSVLCLIVLDLEHFKVLGSLVFLKLSRRPGKFSDNLESFRTIWKHFRQSDNFPDNLESFHTIWKVYRQPGNFIDHQKLSRQSGKFTDNHETFNKSGKFPVNLESFQTIWIFSRQYGKFRKSRNCTDNLETFQTIWNK